MLGAAEFFGDVGKLLSQGHFIDRIRWKGLQFRLNFFDSFGKGWQEVSVFDERIDVTDVPTEMRIVKMSSVDGEAPIQGAVFRIWNGAGDFDETLTTDADGVIALEYLKHGSYHMQEAKAADGYVVNDVDIATKAHDAETGTNQGTLGDKATLVDAVSFEGLTPDNRYKLFTALMDKQSGEPVADGKGNPVVIETDFAPEEADGTVEVAFELDTTRFEGWSLVFLEKLADAQNNVIAKHEDIDDEGQTIEFPASDVPDNPVGKGYPKTGAYAAKAAVAASAAVIADCGLAGAAYAASKRRKAKADPEAESVDEDAAK